MKGYLIYKCIKVQSCENVKKEEIIALKIRRMSPNEATLSRDEKEITGKIFR